MSEKLFSEELKAQILESDLDNPVEHDGAQYAFDEGEGIVLKDGEDYAVLNDAGDFELIDPYDADSDDD